MGETTGMLTVIMADVWGESPGFSHGPLTMSRRWSDCVVVIPGNTIGDTTVRHAGHGSTSPDANVVAIRRAYRIVSMTT